MWAARKENWKMKLMHKEKAARKQPIFYLVCQWRNRIYASGRKHGWKQGSDTNVSNPPKMAGHSQRQHPQQENLGRGKWENLGRYQTKVKSYMKAIQKVKIHSMRVPALDWMTATLDVQLVLARKGTTINRELDQHQWRESHILSNLPIPLS